MHDNGLEESFRPYSIAVTLKSHDRSGEEIAQGYHGLNHKNKGRCSIDSGLIAEQLQEQWCSVAARPIDASGVDQGMLTASKSFVPLNGVQDGSSLSRRKPASPWYDWVWEIF